MDVVAKVTAIVTILGAVASIIPVLMNNKNKHIYIRVAGALLAMCVCSVLFIFLAPSYGIEPKPSNAAQNAGDNNKGNVIQIGGNNSGDIIIGDNNKNNVTATKQTEKKYDGKLKISFFNGRLSYSTKDSYGGRDIKPTTGIDYLSTPLDNKTYILIKDMKGNIVFDNYSEYSENIIIDLNYGKYSLSAACAGFNDYETEIDLTPENKYDGVWMHYMYLLPVNNFYVTKIKVVDNNQNPYVNTKFEFGYAGIFTYLTTNERGYLNDSVFYIMQGEYLIALPKTDDYVFIHINQELFEKDELVVTYP